VWVLLTSHIDLFLLTVFTSSAWRKQGMFTAWNHCLHTTFGHILHGSWLLSFTSSQVAGIINFDDKVEALHQWDKQVQGLCHKVENIIEHMAQAGVGVSSA
jgi:hypothetical protein